MNTLIYTFTADGWLDITDQINKGTPLAALVDVQSIWIVLKDGDMQAIHEVTQFCNSPYVTLDSYIQSLNTDDLSWSPVNDFRIGFHRLKYMDYTWTPKTLVSGQGFQPYILQLIENDRHDLKILPKNSHNDSRYLCNHHLAVIDGKLLKLVYDGYNAYVVNGTYHLEKTEPKEVDVIHFSSGLKVKSLTPSNSGNLKSEYKLDVSAGKHPLVIIYGLPVPTTQVGDGEYKLSVGDEYLLACKTHHEGVTGEELLDTSSMLSTWLSDSFMSELTKDPDNFLVELDHPFTFTEEEITNRYDREYTTLQPPSIVLFKENGYIQQYYIRPDRGHYRMVLYPE